MNSKSDIPYVFFGTPEFSVDVLEQLDAFGLPPALVVTAPDRERDRGQKRKPSPVKAWAQTHDTPVLTPETIDGELIQTLKSQAPENNWPVFVVVAYGEILPSELIYMPKENTLNLHPSLLPKVRGPAPIRGTILKEDQAGVTIIELDEKMDHGPIVAQKEVTVEPWPPRYPDLKDTLATVGGQLLADTIPAWVNNNSQAQPQDHEAATYIEKFSSEDGEIDFSDPAEMNLRKIRAFTDWPKAHFFVNDTRVIITSARIDTGKLTLERVKPSGYQEMDYASFQQRF